MMKRLFLIIAFWAAGIAGASAQMRLTLPQALDLALSENPTVKVAEMEVQRYDYVKRQTWGNLLPQLSASGSYTRSIVKSEMRGGISFGADNTFAVQGDLSLPLFAPSVYRTLKMNDAQMATAVEAARASRIDLTAEELITRLKAGKIYKPEKVQTALDNFFRQENILQLRELALKEVALRVEKKVENEVTESPGLRHEKFLAVIDSSEKSPRRVIRKTARLATRFNAHFAVLYVQTDRESSDRIPLANQRYLINNFKLASELGGEVLQIHSNHPIEAIIDTCVKQKISTVCICKPKFTLLSLLYTALSLKRLINRLSHMNIDLIILS
ncbi:MAG: hypothetical protein EGP73_12770 [Alistipes indistinctus]|uniref:TolC family protein n=1 Tax=Alistipes indistinctus TaxID=626932 RepID=UPI00241D2109|nr:TolC family protein [Alistipes indistinctus]MBD9135705.1 hypothetical protein [Alistipes indistinctus]